MINPAVDDLAEHTSITTACALLGRARGSHYRAKEPPLRGPATRRPAPANALTHAEQGEVLAVLTSQRFVDKSVAQTWATLLDEGVYLGSISTFYRVLREAEETRERRRQATHPAKVKPELVATQPNQVWSWDITKLHGPAKWTYYYLYVILDIFSRYVVAWTIAAREDSNLAKELLEHAMGVHGVPDVVHADRGTSMTSKPVAQLLVDLGVTRSHSRPHVSNDNPYIESEFRTLKNRSSYPGVFASLAEASMYVAQHVHWYNHAHHHSGIALYTPAQVHDGSWKTLHARRQVSLADYHARHPERFRGHRAPVPAPKAWAGINHPGPE